MIAMIAAIAAKRKVQQSQWSKQSYGNHFPGIAAIAAIAATMIAEIEKVLYQQSLWSLESGFHMIAMITGIADIFFLTAIAAITATVAIIWKPGFNG